MHGAGNDYLYIDATREVPPLTEAMIQQMSDRHFGIGGDGVVLICKSDIADLRMQMHNADGSEGAMCGNAIRCVAKFGIERGLVQTNPIRIETSTGVKEIACALNESGEVISARVDMGAPELRSDLIPVNTQLAEVRTQLISELDSQLDLPYEVTCVSMGNPHAVIFVDTITDQMVLEHGPRIETSPAFPDRVNVEFAKVHNRSEITMRVWERGSGETLACGTGACAVVVAAILKGLVDREVTVHLLGGDLQIEWPQSDDQTASSVFKTGPAEFVFDGTYTFA